jgi:hypothetical protein
MFFAKSDQENGLWHGIQYLISILCCSNVVHLTTDVYGALNCGIMERTSRYCISLGFLARCEERSTLVSGYWIDS